MTKRFGARTLARPAAAAALAATALAAAPRAARAQATMTFQPAACAAGVGQTIGGTYAEAGYRINATPRLVTWCADSPDYAGPGAFIGAEIIGLAPGAAAVPPTARLFRDDGTTRFGVTSIDLANLVSAPLPALSLTFVGVLAGGGSVSQTFTLPAQGGATAFQTFAFDAAFADLETLIFPTPEFQAYQFTNIRFAGGAVSAVPEPATVALTGVGLLALGGIARRREGRG